MNPDDIPESAYRAWIVEWQWLVPPPGESERRPWEVIAMSPAHLGLRLPFLDLTGARL